MKFSILSWNIWFYNQIEGPAREKRLFDELKRLVETHEPDLIAMNEVVQSYGGDSIPALKYLDSLGYTHNHCADLGRLNDYWMSGAALCSKHRLKDPRRLVISKNGFAAKRGYPGYDKQAIGVRVAMPGKQEVRIIVAHPQATIDDLHEHKAGMRRLENLLRSKDYSENTILVGDMNEWRMIPGAFRSKVSDVMHSRTGSILRPTWRYDAHRFSPLRLNLDYVYWSKRSDFSLKDFKVLASDASDHRPLLATFEY